MNIRPGFCMNYSVFNELWGKFWVRINDRRGGQDKRARCARRLGGGFSKVIQGLVPDTRDARHLCAMCGIGKSSAFVGLCRDVRGDIHG